LKRTLSAFSVFVFLGLGLVSCSSYNAPQTGGTRSGLKFRAFVSNPTQPARTGGGFPGLDIMDASKDVLSFYTVSLSTSEPDAGMMVESPKRDRTLVFSPSNNGLAIVSNAQESVAVTMPLPGATESMFVWTDNTTAFIAVPSVPIAGQASPGGVGRINISSGATTATMGIPGARFLVPSPDGSKILVISDSTNTVTLLDPNLITTGNPLTPVLTPAGPFDKPVGAVFSADGTKAYVLNSGPELGGSAASVSVVDMSTLTVQGTPIPVPGGATVALLQGTSLFVAGTPSAPANDCSGVTPATSATSCGRLTVVDTVALTAGTPVPITDGYHDHMQMGANGQLFVGSQNCTNINISGGEVRGCLSIVNSGTGGGVIAPPDNGNVTAIEPIPNRNVVYVCEGGALRIYDTTTDQLQITPEQPNVVGQAIDVKVVDF
jgi:hypothetical protein